MSVRSHPGPPSLTASPAVSPLLPSKTALHASALQQALSKFAMPAMSPTMTEGGIATWKKKEGESFAPGDVLVEIVRDPIIHVWC